MKYYLKPAEGRILAGNIRMLNFFWIYLFGCCAFHKTSDVELGNDGMVNANWLLLRFYNYYFFFTFSHT